MIRSRIVSEHGARRDSERFRKTGPNRELIVQHRDTLLSSSHRTMAPRLFVAYPTCRPHPHSSFSASCPPPHESSSTTTACHHRRPASSCSSYHHHHPSSSSTACRHPSKSGSRAHRSASRRRSSPLGPCHRDDCSCSHPGRLLVGCPFLRPCCRRVVRCLILLHPPSWQAQILAQEDPSARHCIEEASHEASSGCWRGWDGRTWEEVRSSQVEERGGGEEGEDLGLARLVLEGRPWEEQDQ